MTGSAPPAVQAEGLSKRYSPGTWVLDAVDLSVNRGEVMGILGPSGSGKSTLLLLLGLLLAPDAGTLTLGGETVPLHSRARCAQIRKNRIGLLFQSPMLFPRMSVLDNVLFRARYLGLPRHAWMPSARERLAALGLCHLADRRADTLSGGEAQRVALARALLTPVDLLLADEPTGNLDTENAHQVARAIAASADSGTAVILVTHNPELLPYTHQQRCCRNGKLTPP